LGACSYCIIKGGRTAEPPRAEPPRAAIQPAVVPPSSDCRVSKEAVACGSQCFSASLFAVAGVGAGAGAEAGADLYA